MIHLEAPVRTIGALQLCTERQMLSGPRGWVDLEEPSFVVMERLSRQPGETVLHDELLDGAFPDRAVYNRALLLRELLARMRATISTVGAATIALAGEASTGYRLYDRRAKA